jgi:hypothetical protein
MGKSTGAIYLWCGIEKPATSDEPLEPKAHGVGHYCLILSAAMPKKAAPPPNPPRRVCDPLPQWGGEQAKLPSLRRRGSGVVETGNSKFEKSKIDGWGSQGHLAIE